MKISTFFKEAAIDVAAIVGGGAALVGVGVGTAVAVGGAPLIAAGAAIGGAVAGPTILVGRVASHIIDGIQSKFDPEGNHNVIARTLKVLPFGAGLAVGAGVAVGIAFIPALGLTVATAASVIGAVALAAVVGYVAYLVLRGVCNLMRDDHLNGEQIVPLVPDNDDANLNNDNDNGDVNNELIPMSWGGKWFNFDVNKLGALDVSEYMAQFNDIPKDFDSTLKNLNRYNEIKAFFPTLGLTEIEAYEICNSHRYGSNPNMSFQMLLYMRQNPHTQEVE